MDDAFQSEIQPAYVHLRFPDGCVCSAESVAEVWSAVSRLCEEHSRNKILIEARRPECRLDTMSAFESGRALAEKAIGLSIAVCLYEYEFDELTTFFKTVVQNRGVKIEYFTDVDAALRWLDVHSGENAARGM